MTNVCEPGANGKAGNGVVHPFLRALAVRVAAIAVMVSILAAGILTDLWLLRSSLMLAAMIAAANWIVLGELYGICRSAGETPFRTFGIGIAVVLAFLHWLTLPKPGSRFFGDLSAGEDLLWGGLALAVIGAMLLQATKRDNDRAVPSISVTLFGLLYVWLMTAFLLRIRHLGEGGILGGTGWNETGFGCFVGCVVVSKMSDVGGFLFGNLFGRRRLIPRISPGKSWEGAIGGVACSVLAALACRHPSVGFLPFLDTDQAVLFGAIVGVVALCGDLGESLLKRGLGVKDAGNLVPGFGGFMDVVDSLLPSAPVSYFFFKAVMAA
ncbi:MAG: phosphatidate cytidylyltransferase [Planctomycetota bacterium]|nr:phosphatidate cytidylyltransferase [Planctomycetota bacterium]